MNTLHKRFGPKNRAGGFSLIELLVSMVIALVVTLAITTVMIQGEGSKRSTTSVNDVNQTGAYVTYVLDRQVRSAGSGFAQRWGEGFGCLINATKGGTAVLPKPATLQAPFANAPQTLRLAPVVIQADAADTTGAGAEVRGDLITVIAGTSGFSESPTLVNTGSVNVATTPASLQLPNTIGYSAGDLVLLADTGVAGGCMIEQVSAIPAAGMLQLSGSYYSLTGSGVALSNFGSSTYAIQLGNPSSTPANPPQLMIYGVGDNRTLFSYDLLFTGATDAPVPIADGVIEMRALYGLDNATAPPDGTLDTWVLPVATSDPATSYDAATLRNGSPESQIKLRQIVAIRLGFILRTSLKEKQAIPTNNVLTLFGDLDPSVHRTRTLAGDDLYYRFRTVEVTVPLRNVMSAPPSP